MYAEQDLVPLSALQHFLFCKRQCALIHVEQQWVENVLTAKGRIFHRRVDRAPSESRPGVRIARGVRLRSLKLGLSGKADVVELHATEKGKWRPFPVEYKSGQPKSGKEDEVQLCAQGMCLEEMLDVPVLRGALFYGRTRRRVDVTFDESLRSLTVDISAAVHALLERGETPVTPRQPKCERCSLLPICLPDATGSGRSATEYLATALTARGGRS